MAIHKVTVGCHGRIHDDDTWSSDEEASYDWVSTIWLWPGGPAKEWCPSQTVDGEVMLKLSLWLCLTSDYALTIYGALQLWEGPLWTQDDSESVPVHHIAAGESADLFAGQLKNTTGDWATATAYANVAPKPQTPTTDPPAQVAGTEVRDPLSAMVKVIAETGMGRNVRFQDEQSGRIMTRRVFVDEIKRGYYPRYYVRDVNGVPTPQSKPTDTTSDNLG